jgi:hypothetical protein
VSVTIRPPLACAAGACVCRDRSRPSNSAVEVTWLPFGPSFFAVTTQSVCRYDTVV